MKSDRFLERYLISVTDRLTIIAIVISLSFWLVISIWKAATFSGTLLDIMIVIAGLSTTLFVIISPKEYETDRILITDKRKYIAQIFDSLQYFSILWIWAGLITLIFEVVSKRSLSAFAIVPEAFGILGVIVVLFFPTRETFED